MPQVFESDSDPYLSTKQPSQESGARVELASGGSAGHHVVLVPRTWSGSAGSCSPRPPWTSVSPRTGTSGLGPLTGGIW